MFIFSHFVKTGGSTIINKFNKHLEGFQDALSSNIILKNKSYPDGTIMLSGHEMFYGVHEYLGVEGKYFTVLREPASWIISVYNHDASKRKAVNYPIPSFNKWYNDGGPNFVLPVNTQRNKMFTYACRLYNCETLEEIKQTLDKYWFVTTTGLLDLDAKFLFQYFNLPDEVKRKRVSGTFDEFDNIPIYKYEKLTKELKEKIYEENPIDVELFHYVQELRINKDWELLKTLKATTF